MQCVEEYERWCKMALEDSDVVLELNAMRENFYKIQDAFYRNLEFGTGGLRGIIGAGTNRMNIYTVGKASKGLSDYLNKKNTSASVVIGYDSRIKSEEFAKHAATVFVANGIKVFLWPDLLPVPTVSYAVRYLRASAGVMITASHNPSKYNGYKVYGYDGCQITTETAKEILEEIEKNEIFEDVRILQFDDAISSNKIEYIKPEVLDGFINEVKRQSVLYGEEIDKNIAIVYSPLNGTGLIPVTRVLVEGGYSNISLVSEQEKPDGDFPTCKYPNPEMKEAMSLGMDYAKKRNADLLLATDPDCDRVGIAVKDVKGLRGLRGEYVLLTGNETGILLLDYICTQKIKHGMMPHNPVMIKTIVTTDMATQIAKEYGVEVIECLTGFKFIGEQIGLMEENGRSGDFIFGMEESYGYLTGDYVRDKDAVDGAYMICEMFSYYASQGIGLVEKLDELYQKYGYRIDTLHSFEFEGQTGVTKMQQLMESFRNDINQFGNQKVDKKIDYLLGVNSLPKSNVLKFILENESSVVIRPSGTEPKIKFYISNSGKNRIEASKIEKEIYEALSTIVDETIKCNHFH